jgi:two-component system CAI-1 autoinducer sensor kinase/phosphatase CqsS
MKLWIYSVYSRIKRSLFEGIEHSLPHVVYIGLVGAIGYPLYYWIWHYVFPQPYENLELRLLGSLLFLGLALFPIWPAKLRPYINVYWLISMTYGLAFFFIYMLLMNQGNIVWAMSTMAGLTLLILVTYDWVLTISMALVGSIIAVLAYLLTSNEIVLSHYLAQLPVYLFLLIAGSIFNYKSVRLKQEKLKVLASVGAEISHELRTPLMTIQNHAYGLHKNFPKLLHAYELANAQNLMTNPIRPDVFKALENSIEQIENEVRHSNTIIDMLLMNLGKSRIKREEYKHFSMVDTITQALYRYPFDSTRERDIVKINISDDFDFLGSDILMMHVIFNLVKNALVFTKSVSEANIEISLDKTADTNYLYFKDNGRGIPLQEKSSIFDSFYSSGNQDKGAGTGIGLAFCKKVLVSFNATIECDSEFGKYTEFKLSFPTIKEQVAKNERELT